MYVAYKLKSNRMVVRIFYFQLDVVSAGFNLFAAVGTKYFVAYIYTFAL